MDPRCKSSNDLIRQGANLTESAADVLANLPAHPARQRLARFVRQIGPGRANRCLGGGE